MLYTLLASRTLLLIMARIRSYVAVAFRPNCGSFTKMAFDMMFLSLTLDAVDLPPQKRIRVDVYGAHVLHVLGECDRFIRRPMTRFLPL